MKPSTKAILVNCPDAQAYFNASDDVKALAAIPCDTKVLEKIQLLKGILNININAIVVPKYNLAEMAVGVIKKYPLIDNINRYDVTDSHIEHLNHYLEYVIMHMDTIKATANNPTP
jgi:hypothetical protein